MWAASASSSAGSWPWSGSSSWTWRKVEPLHQPRPMRKATVPVGRGQPGRLGVQAHQRPIRRRLAGQPGQPLAVDRQLGRAPLDPDVATRRRRDDLAVEASPPAARPARPPGSGRWGRGSRARRAWTRPPAAQGGAEPLEPAGQVRSGRTTGDRHATAAAVSGRRCASPARRPRARGAGAGRGPGHRPRAPAVDRCRPGSRRRSRTRR